MYLRLQNILLHMYNAGGPLGHLDTSKVVVRLLINPKKFSQINQKKISQIHKKNLVKLTKTSQELRMLSSVTLDCQVTKIVMNSGSQL